MWKVRNFEPCWAMACNRLARAVASTAGCSLQMNSNIYSFSLSDQGMVARLVPWCNLRDKLLVAFRANALGAAEAAGELADATGEDLHEHLDVNFGRDVEFYFVPTEPEDAEHVAAIKRILVSFLVEPQPRVDFDPPSLPDVIEQLSDVRSLKAEGNKMKNCVGRYALRVAERRSFIFRVLRGTIPGVERATLELVPSKPPRLWRLVQLKGIRNSPVTPATQQLVREWLRCVNENPQIDARELLERVLKKQPVGSPSATKHRPAKFVASA
jgi:hypothetical protein